jgi:prolyl-tRNA synthetase
MPRKPVFWSQTFIPTLRDHPAGPLSAAHKLLIRAGYWRPAGYLPLGVSALARMQAIAHEELAALGAEELHFPAAGALSAMQELARAAGHSPRLWYRIAAHRTDDIGLDLFAHNSPDAAASIQRTLQRCGVDVLPNAPDGAPIDDPEGDLQPEAFATPDCGTIAEVAAFTGLPATAQMKSLVMVADGQPTLALVRGDHHLSRPKLGQILHAEDIRPATTPQVQDWFGADPGSLGPVGINNLRIVADAALLGRRNMISGANRTGYHLRNVTPGRDFTAEYYDLRDGYTTGLLQTAATHYIGLPACGLNFGAILRLVAERDADADGLCLPAAIAPYDVVITPVNNAEPALRDAATTILNECAQLGINALYDDRDERPGVKFKDADLIGVPWRMTIGSKKLALGQLELTERKSHATQDVAQTDAVATLAARLEIDELA